MRIVIFDDKDGMCRSLRGSCTQPVMGGSSAMKLEHAKNNSIYTAVMEVFEVNEDCFCKQGQETNS